MAQVQDPPTVLPGTPPAVAGRVGFPLINFVHGFDSSAVVSSSGARRRHHDCRDPETSGGVGRFRIAPLGSSHSDLERLLESAYLPAGPVTVCDALTQVCLHSHGHRAQCATRFRTLGGEPPSTDYVLWVKERPDPVWAY
jgi:hypothetical protein